MTSPSLMIESLEVRGFRGFRDLRIKRFGRVNLIVGKNSVGKSSLLDALRLYAHEGSIRMLWQILEARDERSRDSVTGGLHARTRSLAQDDLGATTGAHVSEFKFLFHGRPDPRGKIDPIEIGPLGRLDLSVAIVWYVEQIGDGGLPEYRPIPLENRDSVADVVPALSVTYAGRHSSFRIDRPTSLPLWHVLPPATNCRYVFAGGLSNSEMATWWDAVALFDLEQAVIDSMKIISPGIQRLSFLGPVSDDEDERSPWVRISGSDEPLPLRSLGDGMTRLLGIGLALVNARAGMLLIDEVENGLHYSVQPDVWRLIFETARALNVQVFATTHSWDCISAFQKAANESNEEGVLIRLAERNGKIIADNFEERELAIATQERIELR